MAVEEEHERVLWKALRRVDGCFDRCRPYGAWHAQLPLPNIQVHKQGLPPGPGAICEEEFGEGGLAAVDGTHQENAGALGGEGLGGEAGENRDR